MDVHEGLGTDGTDTTQTMWEPPGYDSDASGTDGTDPHGYDGSGTADTTDSSGGTDSADSAGGSDSADGSTGSGSSGPEDGSAAAGTMTVEVDGETRELPTERDYTGDGKADAVVETADGKVIVFADTENNETGDGTPDGRADEAYVVDKSSGQVIGAAHIDPDSGTWVEGTDADGPSAVGSNGTETTPTGGGTTGGEGTGGEATGAGTSGGDAAPGGVVTVEYEGHEIGVQKTIDTDGDGVADSGVLYADGRTVVVTDTDGDPDAEQIALVDSETGRITEVAHVDPRTGEWEEGPAPDQTGGGTTETGSGTTGTGSGTGATETGTETTGGGTAGGGQMTVEVGGRTQDVPVDRDYTGDGRPDAAVETKDGNVIVFADTENNETGAAGPDGKADEAWIVDKSTGQVVGAAHVDPRTGEWVDGADSDGPSSAPSTTGQASS